MQPALTSSRDWYTIVLNIEQQKDTIRSQLRATLENDENDCDRKYINTIWNHNAGVDNPGDKIN